MKAKIFIFGSGQEAGIVRPLIKDKVKLLGYLDNNMSRQGVCKTDGKPILAPGKVEEYEFDVILIAMLKNISQVKAQLRNLGVPEDKVISFFFAQDTDVEKGKGILRRKKWRQAAGMVEANYEIKKLAYKMDLIKGSAVYELGQILKYSHPKYPVILSADKAIDKIANEGCSLCRFGDGEFEIMRGNKRPAFQLPTERLAERLIEVFNSNAEKILLAIPDQFGCLNRYTEQAADSIREYMSTGTRAYLNHILDYEKEYYDAYISRPYLIYKDREKASDRFQMIKQIWNKRNIVIIEGRETRMGVGNDLLDNVSDIKRIIGPAENAFEKYDEILQAALSMGKDKLYIILLGPSATVLAYDLAMKGYQAVDIGHVDIEYEWYLNNSTERVDIPGKYVNEVCGGNRADLCVDKAYLSQIMYDI